MSEVREPTSEPTSREDQIIETYKRISNVARFVFTVLFLIFFIYFFVIASNTALGIVFVILAVMINLVPKIMGALGIEYRIR